MEWIESLNRALRYIEDHLTDETLDVAALANAAAFSPFYLQRMFGMMTDMTLAEYIRQRRLSMAGQELQVTGARVIDVALKYGYETPESFQKAFRRFHGVNPSAAAATRTQLHYLNPLQIEVKLTGGTMMDYTIEKMDALEVMGKETKLDYDKGFEMCPKLWDEYYSSGANQQVPGYLALCQDDEPNTFNYLIGSFCKQADKTCEGFVRKQLPACTWAKFRCYGPLPQSVQKLNRQIFTEWLPGNPDYELDTPMNLEVYAEGDMQSEDFESQIWIPVRPKKA